MVREHYWVWFLSDLDVLWAYGRPGASVAFFLHDGHLWVFSVKTILILIRYHGVVCR